MSPHHWKRRLTQLVTGTALLAALASPPPLLAQQDLPPKPLPVDHEDRDKVLPPRVSDVPPDRARPVADLGAFTPLVVRGSGEEGEELSEDDVGEPPDLTPDQQSQLLASLGLALWDGRGPWKVTPARPIVGRASLGFREAQYISVGGGEYPASARIHGRGGYGPVGNVTLRVSASAAGERYLIDCKVSPMSSGLRFSGPGSSAMFTTEHLIAIYEATDTAPASFTIDLPLNSSINSWAFYSCEITSLQ